MLFVDLAHSSANYVPLTRGQTEWNYFRPPLTAVSQQGGLVPSLV